MSKGKKPKVTLKNLWETAKILRRLQKLCSPEYPNVSARITKALENRNDEELQNVCFWIEVAWHEAAHGVMASRFTSECQMNWSIEKLDSAFGLKGARVDCPELDPEAEAMIAAAPLMTHSPLTHKRMSLSRSDHHKTTPSSVELCQKAKDREFDQMVEKTAMVFLENFPHSLRLKQPEERMLN